MRGKDNSLIYLGGSLLFIMIAIMATAIYSQNKSDSTSDIRARAGQTATLKAFSDVASVDDTTQTIRVNNLRFVGSDGVVSVNNLGSWTVTPPAGFNVSGVYPGAKLTVTISPATFIAETHTLTATQITIER